jgi:UDP-N-acetylmuramate-alanine ligase
VAEKSGHPAQGFDTLEAVRERLRERSAPGTILFTMGAGDIYRIADALVAH